MTVAFECPRCHTVEEDEQFRQGEYIERWRMCQRCIHLGLAERNAHRKAKQKRTDPEPVKVDIGKDRAIR